MKSLESFRKFALDMGKADAIFGGGHLENCLASVDGACSASCGDNNECFYECQQNQTGHCFAILG